MATTLTLSARTLILAAVAVTGVATAYSVGAARADAPAPQPTTVVAAAPSPDDAGEDRSAIVVDGTGTVTGVPDELGFSLSAHGKAADVSAAVAESNVATRRVLAALREHDVAREDVQTTGLNVHPVYDYSGDEPRLVGYAASERVAVVLRDLGTAGEAISAAVEAGGNAVRIRGMHLQIGDSEALLRQARAEAFAQAEAKAEQYAGAAGRELGDLTSVREVVGRPHGGRAGVARAALEAADISQVPIRAGSEEVTVTVSLVWSFA